MIPQGTPQTGNGEPSMRTTVFSLAFAIALQGLCAAPNPSLNEALAGARAGDARAQYIAGMMYMMGQGTRQNLPESARWLERSAQAGMPQALGALANLYDIGQGVPFDATRATRLREQAVRAGNTTAKGQLADDRGMPGQRDFRRASVLMDLKMTGAAIPYAKRAAEAGSGNAQVLLGWMNHFGQGTPVNLAEAVRLYGQSAGNGHPEGNRAMAYMYEFGLGVTANRTTALRYYDRAAAGGSALARRAAANLRSPDYDQPRNYNAGPSSGSSSTPYCGNGNYSNYNGAGRCTDGNGNPNPDGRFVY